MKDKLANANNTLRQIGSRVGSRTEDAFRNTLSAANKLGTRAKETVNHIKQKVLDIKVPKAVRVYSAEANGVRVPIVEIESKRLGDMIKTEGSRSTNDNALLRIQDEYGNAIPHGFSSLEEYNNFTKSLKDNLPEGTQIFFQGSSVTGKSHKTGKPFDEGRVSDYDIGLVNDDLFLESLEIGRDGGFKMKTEPNRIGPLNEKQLEELGLNELAEKCSKQANRPVSFMFFESTGDAMKRPSIMVTS